MKLEPLKNLIKIKYWNLISRNQNEIDNFFMQKYFDQNNQLIFIFGCQRSGTTALCRVFGKSPFIHEFNEDYDLVFDKNCYIKSHDILKNELNKVLKPFSVVKPIMHNHEIYTFYKRYKSKLFIWLYRNYNDVVNSMLNGGDHLHSCIKLQFSKHLKIMKENDQRFKNINSEEYIEFSPDYFLLYWLIQNGILIMFHKSIKNLKVISYDDLITNNKLVLSLFHDIHIPITKGIFGYYKKINSKKVDYTYNGKLLEISDSITSELDFLKTNS